MRAGDHRLRIALIRHMDRILANIPGPGGDNPPDTPEVRRIRQRIREIETGRRAASDGDAD